MSSMIMAHVCLVLSEGVWWSGWKKVFSCVWVGESEKGVRLRKRVAVHEIRYKHVLKM
jgi:hypothetical protein